MFELSVASKYLTPRWRQLSVSIITMISILVIALVVWLIVVFFSVTNGLTKNWVDKLIALTAPVRITPTQEYFHSYYYQIDSISSQSDFNLKTLAEKLEASETDPYDPMIDEEIPFSWEAPDLDSEGNLKDPVKLAFQSINHLKDVSGISAQDYEVTVSNLRLRLLRETAVSPNFFSYLKVKPSQGFITVPTYLGSFDPMNPSLSSAVVPLTPSDISNILKMIWISSDNVQEDAPESILKADKEIVNDRLQTFFHHVTIDALRIPPQGWVLPQTLIPENAKLQGLAMLQENRLFRVIIPPNAKSLKSLTQVLEQDKLTIEPIQLSKVEGQLTIKQEGKDPHPLPQNVPLLIIDGLSFPVKLNPESLSKASNHHDLLFHVNIPIQGYPLLGEVPLKGLEIAQAEAKDLFSKEPQMQPYWTYRLQSKSEGAKLILPSYPNIGEGVILPKSFRDSGALAGDTGYLSYYTPTASSVQEQRIPVYVAGFYDPGIIPIGGKFILANREITSLIRASHNQDDNTLSTGINVRFDNREQAEEVKAKLLQAFKKAGIDRYWKIETYREYDFTKDLLQQLSSEKRLFTLLATVIIIVACSNIISMLIILVNDKKVEIGILRSMGASSASIAAIFGICGVVMGMIGSFIGTLAALLTLQHLQSIVDFIGRIQGHEMFNPVFYGDHLPTEVSFEALSFVIVATSLISLLAGIVPAVKASMLKPSVILRSE